MADAITSFHKHLDECAQCREHPFWLCEVGGPLLKAAGEQAEQEMRELVPGRLQLESGERSYGQRYDDRS